MRVAFFLPSFFPPQERVKHRKGEKGATLLCNLHAVAAVDLR